MSYVIQILQHNFICKEPWLKLSSSHHQFFNLLLVNEIESAVFLRDICLLVNAPFLKISRIWILSENNVKLFNKKNLILEVFFKNISTIRSLFIWFCDVIQNDAYTKIGDFSSSSNFLWLWLVALYSYNLKFKLTSEWDAMILFIVNDDMIRVRRRRQIVSSCKAKHERFQFYKFREREENISHS